MGNNMKKEKTTQEKLNAISSKFCTVNYNENNYSIGGGLVSNKFASNRHEDARNDDGKRTQGELAQIFKKATGEEVSTINEMIDFHFGYRLEWHHAGKLPKRYGGGMKKTYFLNAEQICELATDFYTILGKYKTSVENEKIETERKNNLAKIRAEFLFNNAKKVDRELKADISNYDLFVETNRECSGKYGWFCASKNVYNLKEYYTGYQFESIEKYNEYKNIK